MQTQSLPTDSLPASSALRSVAVDKQDFRDAMARLGSAVNIITTDGPAGRAGFTASAVCSVTDTPPTLLVCLNRSASVYSVFQQNQTLCVNTLCADHESLSNLFGGKSRWKCASQLPVGQLWSPVPRCSVVLLPLLTAISHKLFLSALMTFCFVRLPPLFIAMTNMVWPILTAAITR